MFREDDRLQIDPHGCGKRLLTLCGRADFRSASVMKPGARSDVVHFRVT
jgi:hypothetical protein